jgi:hypothetical protein
MPQQKTRFDGPVPKNPHLLLYHRAGQAMAIPTGAMMGIVMDANKNRPEHRMILREVKPDKLIFQCTCNPTCTVQWIFKAETRGAHAR